MADDERDVLVCPAGRDLSFRGEYQYGSGRYRLYCAHGCASCSFRDRCVKSGRGSRRISVSCNERFRHRMREKMAREGCKLLYSLRSRIIEPVFGQTKHDRGFRKFMLRGNNGATAEMSLVLLVHNLRKCLNKALFPAFSTRIDAAFESLSWHDFITCPWSNERRVIWSGF